MAEHGEHRWIAGAIKRPGRLHRATGTPMGQKIPVSEIAALTSSKNKSLASAARLAQRLRKMNPWEVIKDGDGFWVVKEGTREKVHKSPHKTREEAMQHVKALYAAEGMGEESRKMMKGRMMEGKDMPMKGGGY